MRVRTWVSNVRVADYSGIGDSLVESVRTGILAAKRRLGFGFRSVPITFGFEHSDVGTIRRLLDGIPNTRIADDMPADINAVLREVSACRVVVTGSYHAAVFALSQGIPAVALANSKYYVDKFSGLADQFRVGCALVLLNQPDFPESLATAIGNAWTTAPQLRDLLLCSARAQIEAGWGGYARLREIVQCSDSYCTSFSPREDTVRSNSEGEYS